MKLEQQEPARMRCSPRQISAQATTRGPKLDGERMILDSDDDESCCRSARLESCQREGSASAQTIALPHATQPRFGHQSLSDCHRLIMSDGSAQGFRTSCSLRRSDDRVYDSPLIKSGLCTLTSRDPHLFPQADRPRPAGRWRGESFGSRTGTRKPSSPSRTISRQPRIFVRTKGGSMLRLRWPTAEPLRARRAERTHPSPPEATGNRPANRSTSSPRALRTSPAR